MLYPMKPQSAKVYEIIISTYKHHLLGLLTQRSPPDNKRNMHISFKATPPRWSNLDTITARSYLEHELGIPLKESKPQR
jgi:hypothetical protein